MIKSTFVRNALILLFVAGPMMVSIGCQNKEQGNGVANAATKTGEGDASATPPDTIIFADISESMYKGTINTYRNVIWNVVDAVAPKSKIKILTFKNQTSITSTPLVYEGKPKESDDVFDIVRTNVYPDQPTPDVKESKGTSFQAVLKYAMEESKIHPIRVCIVTDGGLCAAKNSGMTDEDELHASQKLADGLSDVPNFKGLVILPVAPDGVDNQKLQEIVFKKLKATKTIVIATQDSAEEAINTFGKL